MTTTLQTRPIDRPLPAVALPLDPLPAAEFLTVTADRVHLGVVVITVRGEVDLLTSPLLLDALLTHLPGPGSQLIIDLTAVEFFGAAGLTVLDTIRHATQAAGIRLCLIACTRPVLLPLTITGMHTLFDIHPDLTHALPRVGRPSGRMTRRATPDRIELPRRRHPNLRHRTANQGCVPTPRSATDQ